MTEKRGSNYRNYGNVATSAGVVSAWQQMRRLFSSRVEKVAAAAEEKGEPPIQPYQPSNAADIRRATQRAARLQKNAEVSNTAEAWQAAAAAWRVAGDVERANECEGIANGI